jgi:hypothetical protein
VNILHEKLHFGGGHGLVVVVGEVGCEFGERQFEVVLGKLVDRQVDHILLAL